MTDRLRSLEVLLGWPAGAGKRVSMPIEQRSGHHPRLASFAFAGNHVLAHATLAWWLDRRGIHIRV